MLSLLFPPVADQTYRGQWPALWLLWPLVLMKLVMGFNCAGFNPWLSNRTIITQVDGIPLDAMDPAIAPTFVIVFAAWGLGLLLLSLIGLLVLLRYRALAPLMILALTLEQLGRKLLTLLHPTLAPTPAAHGITFAAAINWGFTAILLLALALSLWPRRVGSQA
jgi:hypothetical protein